MITWAGVPPPKDPPIGPAGWLRVGLRGGALLLLLAVCFPLLLLLRLVEAPIWGMDRPITPWITQFVCIWACRILGLRRQVIGTPMHARGAFVSNHVSWLDIFVLNANKRLYFVAKSEVRGWGGIGWLARGTGTLFINRRRGEARAQQALFEDRLAAGHRLLFFPEGTSTDGQRVLDFKSTLFAAFQADRLRDILHIQPVTLRYVAPAGEAPQFYGWWGDMGFGPNLLRMLATRAHGRVEVIYHPDIAVADMPDRKALALACETAVRAGLSEAARSAG
ncbi:lysophospholipid acyltransferase family protein [Rhodophyticola porphyridii]|uniref:1-acyl-sn-glycerol-3-phosphate acyltransferase n=1 Tax=Rhodophyticola porphyridii TaxID=1852017 RepID=A0A3L9Y0N1_9RHOB|nr:lysophospholipid acyltransferase family protein [Rhodophyticola porphyridii]RMA42384.1 1-acyl-sn-glycerol-3-phosphate acyltransferase [Rhodophyticola porphyridii]